MSVLHKCDVPDCVRPSHLFLGTQADNIADMDRKGRRKTAPCAHPFKKGQKNPMAKLRDFDILNIRATYGNGRISQQTIAKQYGVSQTLVGLIVRKKIWTHV